MDAANIRPLAEFNLHGTAMRYSIFIPRLYNLCLELGMQPDKIMPSRAFCSDESQGYPIILIAKHFGTFPFNHGRVGGVVATDRHGPYADHGQDLVIIQASHVGYDPEAQEFGRYRRLQTEHQESSASCGKICDVIHQYLYEYQFAQEHILLQKNKGELELVIDNQLLRQDRKGGLFLKLEKMLAYHDDGEPVYKNSLSTAKVFRASDEFLRRLGDRVKQVKGRKPIGDKLDAGLFFYRREVWSGTEGGDHLESNLIRFMPQIVTAGSPMLAAAIVNTQVEFDRTYRTLLEEPAYQGKRLLFISGLNVDVSPTEDHLFPLTKFIPWAAYIQDTDGNDCLIEQDELLDRLNRQSTENPNQIELDAAIHNMEAVQEVILKIPQH